MKKAIVIWLVVLLLPVATGCAVVKLETQDRTEADRLMPQFETVPDSSENAEQYAADAKRLYIQRRAALQRIKLYFDEPRPKDPEWVWAVVEQIHALEDAHVQLERIEVPVGAVEAHACAVEMSRLHVEAAKLKLEGKVSRNWLKVWQADRLGKMGDDQVWPANVLLKEYLATFDLSVP